ncbi:MAG: PspA-associated protein PspAA [Streptosporangiaceae bacterium]
MIVRILGAGQLEVPDSAADELNELDRVLEAAVEREDEAAFRPALAALLAKVRQVGSPAKADELRPSELIAPHDDATIADVRRLLTDEGLIPG